MQIRTSRMSQTKGNAISVIRHCNRGASNSLHHPDKSFHLTASLSIVVLCTFIHKDSNCHTVHASTLRGTGTRWTLHTSRQRSTAGCSSCSGARTSQLPAIPSSLSTASALTTRFWKLAPTAYPQSPRSVQCTSRTAVSCHSLIASETQRCAEALFKPVLARSIPQTRFDSAHARPSIESGGHNEVVSAHSLAQTRSDPYSPTFAQRDSHRAVSLASGTRVLPSPPGHRAAAVWWRPSRPARLLPSAALSFPGAARPQRADRRDLSRAAAKKKPPPAPPGPPARYSPRPESLTGWADGGRLLPRDGGGSGGAGSTAHHPIPTHRRLAAPHPQGGAGSGRRAPRLGRPSSSHWRRRCCPLCPRELSLQPSVLRALRTHIVSCQAKAYIWRSSLKILRFGLI